MDKTTDQKLIRIKEDILIQLKKESITTEEAKDILMDIQIEVHTYANKIMREQYNIKNEIDYK